MTLPTLNVLGLPVHRVSTVELHAWMQRCLESDRPHRVVTLNPEIALAAHHDPRYAALIRTADIVTADGTGILLALRWKYRIHPERITGTTLVTTACSIAEAQGSRVVVLLHEDGLTPPPLLRAVLRERWPHLEVSVAAVSPQQPLDPSVGQAIRDAAPAALITNFGHPMQERWIAEHLDAFPSVRVAFGVGGAIDYLTGVAPEPPAWIRRFGWEWCWRLLRPTSSTTRFPRRIRLLRVLRAIFLFPLVLFLDYLRSYAPLPHLRTSRT